MYILTLTNKQTNEVHTYDNVIDINAGEKLYYRFQIDTLGLVDGEYDLELTKDGILVGVNTLYVGDYETYSLQYKRGDNTFIDITLNAKLEDATAEINVEKFTLLPVEGYDGFSKVEIDATPLYDVAFGDGYASGSTDSYNEGYQAGIDYASNNANEIAAANAIVLDATENKTYYTKYVDIPAPEVITGEYPNGEKFYDYANLTDIVYNTGIQITPDTRFELWWKQDKADDNYSTIIGAQGGQIMKLAEYDGRYVAEYGGEGRYFDMPVGWNHIIFSKADGVVVNGEQVVDLSDLTGQNYPDVIYINASYLGEKDYNANGSFGMIKIDDTIIIPTPDGFLNTNTNEMLSVAYTANGGSYVYENQDIIPIDNLIKQVNVNIKINVLKDGIKFGYSTFTEVPEYFDFTGGDYTSMFYQNQGLATPPRVTGKVTNTNNCFYWCKGLKSLPNWDFSECYNFDGTFEETNLVDLSEMANWNYPHTGVNWNRCFRNCSNLQKCPAIYTDSATRGFYPIFYNYSDYTYFTDFGGFIGLKNSLTDDRCFPKMPNLTYESCINVLNGLYDFTGNGETPTGDQGQLKVHQNFLDLVGDEISIGVNKGWTITA